MLAVASPDQVYVSFAVRTDGGLLVGGGTAVHDLNRLGDDDGVGFGHIRYDEHR